MTSLTSAVRPASGKGSIARARSSGIGDAAVGHDRRRSGDGRVPEAPCGVCGGRGMERVERSLRVDIPPGIHDGQRIRVTGRGHAGERGGPNGDLFLVVRVREDERFIRDGEDLHTAIDLVRRGGTISIVGVYGGMTDPLPMMTMFDKQIAIRMGQANVKRWVGDILPLLTDEDPLGVDDFATHHLPLEAAPEAYATFQAKDDGMVKVVLSP